jgi:hypothetical protein
MAPPAPAVAPVVQPTPTLAPAAQPAPRLALVAPKPVSPEEMAKAQQALQQKMKELPAQPPAAPGSAPGARPTTVSRPQPFTPIQGPPPAVSAAKQQRLDELLRRYMADEITPEQYQEQRAKILAEP